MSNYAVPILLYHRVGPVTNCPFTVSVEEFERHLQAICAEGFHTIDFSTLEQHIQLGLPFQDPSCIITFDDGYLDYWVYAYPLLRKYGLKSTLFPITNRLTSDVKSCRSSLQQVWSGLLSPKELYLPEDFALVNLLAAQGSPQASYHHLNYCEIRMLHDEGLVEIQSHSHRHFAHFISSDLIGFVNPNSRWSVYTLYNEAAQYGWPVFRPNSALVGTQFNDSPSLRAVLSRFVTSEGGLVFFSQANWEQKLSQEFLENRSKYRQEEKYETLQERRERVVNEIVLSKNLLQEQVGQTQICFSWPWGRYDHENMDILRECGFKLAVTTKYGGYSPGIPLMSLGRISVKREQSAEWVRNQLLYFMHPENILAAYRSYEQPPFLRSVK